MGRRNLREDDRAVKWTLQSYLFVVVLLGAVVVAASSVPTDGGGRVAGDYQTRQVATDVLSSTDDTGDLTAALLYYNASSERWIDSSGQPRPGVYTTLQPVTDHPLWTAVRTGLERRGLAYNVAIEYRTGNGTERRRVVYQGPPSGGAVTVTRSVVLTDDMVPAASVQSSDGTDCTLGELGNTSTAGGVGCRAGAYLAPDATPDSERYNVLQVRLTVWRV